MKILVNIDQAAAIRAGIDAPRSTAQVEVDPAVLTQTERDILAAILVDGHDATKREVTIRDGKIAGTRASPCWGLILLEPTVAALREELANIAEALTKLEADRADEQRKRDAKLEDAIAHPKERTETVHFDASGDLVQWGWKVQREIRWIGVDSYDQQASEPVLARHEVALRESQARRKAAIEAVLPSVREELARLRDDEAQRAEQAKLAADSALVLETARRAAIGELVGGSTETGAIFPEDADRLLEGLMSEEEQETIVKAHLFYAFDLLEFPRYEKLTKADVPHDDGCCEPRSKFVAKPAESLSRGEYDVLKRIRIVAKEIEALDGVTSVEIEPRTHTGWCPNEECEAGIVERTGALVTVEWYGVAYACELWLDADESEPAEPDEPSGEG